MEFRRVVFRSEVEGEVVLYQKQLAVPILKWESRNVQDVKHPQIAVGHVSNIVESRVTMVKKVLSVETKKI